LFHYWGAGEVKACGQSRCRIRLMLILVGDKKIRLTATILAAGFSFAFPPEVRRVK
jgi:hypothetical protein